MFASGAKALASLGLRYGKQSTSQCLSRSMGSAAKESGGLVETERRSANRFLALHGESVPQEMTGPEFMTHGSLTLRKLSTRKGGADWWSSVALGTMVWYTMMYHFYNNWEEHYYGEIWLMERDGQMNGWDEHPSGHGSGHAAEHAEHH